MGNTFRNQKELPQRMGCRYHFLDFPSVILAFSLLYIYNIV
ncbi:hypothetical protein BACCAP_02276 [Pseudoflavonifractor capillosus ATCC 29799]|uniref:Uncharacterized protein n=1 Tax=Pseudoflavonifractor capillosus ATCC 29799 TaxID=411467 RepID=A6NVN3_9FIRM|nr:hypothetical protein BACCAP_02276 [Pseudoflavonifractor capillosus ATCC 29799]